MDHPSPVDVSIISVYSVVILSEERNNVTIGKFQRPYLNLQADLFEMILILILGGIRETFQLLINFCIKILKIINS